MMENDDERGGKMKNVFKFILSLLFLFGPCLYFGVLGKTTEMGIVLVPSVLSAVLLNFDHLKKYVSVIKMKDIELKFKDMIEEANATIEQLNNSQYTLTKVATEILYRHKFYGGVPVGVSVELVDDLYETAKNTNAISIINGPIKLAYQRLLSEAFGKISYGINDSEDKKKISSITETIYVFKGNSNMIRKCDSIPSPAALRKKVEEIELLEESRQAVLNSIFQFEKLCIQYQEKYEKLNLIDTI